uniref:Uncharacterized protein n=1 Tax=Panagrolaimus superbus TaxID=310955 RepID=A0A914Z8K1_9BILA
MELMIFRPKDFALHYSCNYTVPASLLGDHRILASFYALTAFLLITIYVPCLHAIIKSDYIQQSCYKIMFFIGLLDIPGLVLSGITSGIFGYFNLGFCNAPKLFYFLGCFAEFTWNAQTCSSILLAINRCMVMTTRNTADNIFGGRKTWFTLIFPLMYGTFAFFFTQPVIFSPVLMTWLFNPHFGIQNDSYFNAVFYQVLLICSSTTSLGILYVVMQFIAFPTEVYFLAQFLWITYTGIPPIIYLTMNKYIRMRVFSIIRKESPSISPFVPSTAGSTGTKI